MQGAAHGPPPLERPPGVRPGNTRPVSMEMVLLLSAQHDGIVRRASQIRTVLPVLILLLLGVVLRQNLF